MEFIHLHVHTEYSLRQGAIRLADGLDWAAQQGMSALAITDSNALYGAISFYRKALAKGVRPILGVQLQVGLAADEEVLREGRLGGPALDTAVFLAEDLTGYTQLVQLVTTAQGRTRHPFVTFDEVAQAAQGVIALVGGGESHILQASARGEVETTEQWLRQWQTHMPAGQLYIDVQDHAVQHERQGLPALLRSARSLDLPLVATNDAHYLQPSDAEVQRVLGQLEGQHARMLQGNKYDLATAAEMHRRFAKLPEALSQTPSIAERCHVVFPPNPTLLPKYPVQPGETANQVLRRAAEVGVRQRYGQVTEAIQVRLTYELDIIERLDFADYFLVVADFIRFAHKHGISTGPGRGSAAGSLIAYALRITDVDPLKHQLLFERFLNPERVSWPDIDTDFEYERRNEVLQYVVERYGAAAVAQIGTFGTLAARAALRDAGRVLGTTPVLVDRVAKLIPSQPGITLAEARKTVEPLTQLIATDEQADRLWQTACGIEGFPRHTSIHAAGVVISPVPLSTLVPVQPGPEGIPVTQYAMEDIEYLGLIKMDFLGLRTLTLIDQCVASVKHRTGQKIDWKQVSEADPATYAMLTKGETNGCFQLESSGVRRVLRDLKPTGLEDLIAVISLYRPGPMENIPTFIAAKQGHKRIEYPHPDLAPILEATYGVIVYQEQIMQIASTMAGFSLGQSDLLRRAVSKKKRDVLDAQRARFVEGAQARGYSLEVADAVYDLIVRFADYGFNRSHAAAYALLAFRTSYLRANHTADFLAALLSMTFGSQDKTDEYLRDAKKSGMSVRPPCVQESQPLYTVEVDGAIRTGLLSVRNVGRGAVDAIMEARGQGPFTSLVDFLGRVNARSCNRKAVESLLAAGALQRFLPDHITEVVAGDILDAAYRDAAGTRTEGLGMLFDLDTVKSPGHARSQRGPAATEAQPVRAPEALYIRYDAQSDGQSLMVQVRKILGKHAGPTRVALFDTTKQKLRVLEAKWSVTLSAELIAELEEHVGLANARVGVSRWK